MKVVLFFATALAASGASVLTNGSFEAPSDPALASGGTGFKDYPTIPGWVPYGSATAVYLSGTGNDISNWPKLGANGTNQFADVGNALNTGIQQSFTIPLPLSQPTLKWFDATYEGVLPGVITDSSYFVSLLDGFGGTIASGGFLTRIDNWTERSLPGLPASLPSGTYTLIFEATSGPFQKDLLLDEVSLVAIPELQSPLLLVTAMIGGLCKRRRN